MTEENVTWLEKELKKIPKLTVDQKATMVLELRDLADKIEKNEIEPRGFRSQPKMIRPVGKHIPIKGFWSFELVYSPCDEELLEKNKSTGSKPSSVEPVVPRAS